MAEKWNAQTVETFENLDSSALFLAAVGAVDYNFTKTTLLSFLDARYTNEGGSSIVDSNSNELLTFSEVASAVNYLEIANNATGSAPSLAALGDDTNIDLNINAKGSGHVVFGSDVTIDQASGEPKFKVIESGGTSGGVEIEDNGSTTARLNKTNTGGFVLFEIDSEPTDGTSNARIRFGRNTNTTGE